MTKIYLEQDGSRYRVSATGHATGSAEVCAAVSVLMFTLTGWLENYGGDDTGDDPITFIDVKLEPGDALVEFSGGAPAEAVFNFMAVGFLQLQNGYKDYISVNIK